VVEKVDGTFGNLTTGFNGQCSSGDGLAVMDSGGGETLSMRSILECGWAKQRVVVSAVRHGGGLGAFYRPVGDGR
jgi:hypothetical protein